MLQRKLRTDARRCVAKLLRARNVAHVRSTPSRNDFLHRLAREHLEVFERRPSLRGKPNPGSWCMRSALSAAISPDDADDGVNPPCREAGIRQRSRFRRTEYALVHTMRRASRSEILELLGISFGSAALMLQRQNCDAV